MAAVTRTDHIFFVSAMRRVVACTPCMVMKRDTILMIRVMTAAIEITLGPMPNVMMTAQPTEHAALRIYLTLERLSNIQAKKAAIGSMISRPP